MPRFVFFIHLSFLAGLGAILYLYGYSAFIFGIVMMNYGAARGMYKTELDLSKKMRKCERCKRKFHGAMIEKCQFEGCVHDASALIHMSEQLAAALRLANERATAARPTAEQLRSSRPRRVIRGLSPSPTVEPPHASPNTDKAPTTEALPRAFYDGS